ncbi:MAG: hypothetical protein E6Q97_15795, partial [Desulfurellales bacterium]
MWEGGNGSHLLAFPLSHCSFWGCEMGLTVINRAVPRKRQVLRGDQCFSNSGLALDGGVGLWIHGDENDPPLCGFLLHRPAKPRPTDQALVHTSVHHCIVLPILFTGKFRVAPFINLGVEQAEYGTLTFDGCECGVAQVLLATVDYWGLGVPAGPTLTGGLFRGLQLYGKSPAGLLLAGKVTMQRVLQLATAGTVDDVIRFHNVPNYDYKRWPKALPGGGWENLADGGCDGVPESLIVDEYRMREGSRGRVLSFTRETVQSCDIRDSLHRVADPEQRLESYSTMIPAAVKQLRPAVEPPAEPKDPPPDLKLHPSTPLPSWGLDVTLAGAATRTIAGTSFPDRIGEGELWNVSGGPYVGSIGYIPLRGGGTAAKPARIRFVPPVRFAQKLYLEDCKYLVIEGLDAHKVEIGPGCENVIVRARAGRGVIAGGGVGNGGGFSCAGTAAKPTKNIVFLDCVAEDCGDWLAEFDQDVHGWTFNGVLENIFLLKAAVRHCSGNGVQINAGSLANQPNLRRVVIAGCVSRENKQAFVGVKQSTDVLVIGNDIADQRPIGAHPSEWGAGVGYQYDPERVTFAFNRIANCCYGLASGSGSGLGNGKDVLVLGNHIEDCLHDPRYEGSYNPESAWGNAGLSLVALARKAIFCNTIQRCDAGINVMGGESLAIVGNIVDRVSPRGNHVYIETPAGFELITVNLFSDVGGPGQQRRGNQRGLLEKSPLALDANG